jgi:hypothetical protein
MYFSKRALRALPQPIHTGSGETAKGLSHPAAVTRPCSAARGYPVSRDFAAVMAQTSAGPNVFVILSTYSIK